MRSKFVSFTAALVIVASCTAQIYTGAAAANVEPSAANDFITQTVYGFLDFTTTIGNTVMVFSPQSAAPEGPSEPSTSEIPTIQTKPAETKQQAAPNIQPSKTSKTEETKKGTKIIVNSVVEQNVVNFKDEKVHPVKTENAKTRVEVVTQSPPLSTIIEIRPKDDIPGVKNNLAEPEYDFLSKQPTEVVDETYKVINLRPSAKSGGKPRPTQRREKENPTGLVTKLGGSIVKDGLTTVHETSVIGTYINGKYAQVLQSSSRIINGDTPNLEAKIRPSNAQRILKTIGPQQGTLKPQIESTIDEENDDDSIPLEGLYNGQPGSNQIRQNRKQNNPTRPKYRNKIVEDVDLSNEARPSGKNRPSTNRPNYKNRAQTTTTEQSVTRRRTGFRPNSQSSPSKQFKNTKTEQGPLLSNPSLKSKLPRTQGRWSYKTSPKPRIVIRKQAEDEPRPPSVIQNAPPPAEVTSISVLSNGSEEPLPVLQRKIQDGEFDVELDESESEDVVNVSVHHEQPSVAEQILPVETLNVEISTPSDFNDIYFEIATMKSPYEFQVGTLRNTRYVTVTSTIKKSFATVDPVTSVSPTEPLTENILANTGAAYETSLPLDSSIATLPAISLDGSQATPPLETITETFSTTQTLLKTHLLPVIHQGNTTKMTLVQTYNIARIVTATKTLPPMEIYQFIPSKTLNEFNSKLDEAGSELHLELDFGDDDRDDDDIPKRVLAPSTDLDADLDIFKSINPSAKVKTEPATNAPEPPITSEQAQQLALLKYFGQGQQQQQQQQQQQVITTSKPVVFLETVYESHVIPVVSAGNTIFSTLSRPVATVPKTTYEYGTSTIAPVLPPQVPQIPQLPQVPQVPQLPLFPQPQPAFTVTTAPFVTQTLATVSDSRVLKLTFGAKTAYTTLYSTKVVPTELTTYLTSTVAVQPTVPAYPGFYPPVGYPGYPYIG